MGTSIFSNFGRKDIIFQPSWLSFQILFIFIYFLSCRLWCSIATQQMTCLFKDMRKLDQYRTQREKQNFLAFIWGIKINYIHYCISARFETKIIVFFYGYGLFKNVRDAFPVGRQRNSDQRLVLRSQLKNLGFQMSCFSLSLLNSQC